MSDIANLKGQRNSNVELLRIFSMLLIIASHYSFHGITNFSEITHTFNYLFLKNITLGSLGVQIFILLFGYFSVDSSGTTAKKIFKLWLQVWTYSLGIFLYLTIIGKVSFSWKTLIKSLFPFSFSGYWFFTSYILFYLLSPYINKLLLELTKKQYSGMIAIMLVIWSILPTFTQHVPAGGDFSLFLLLYSIGGFIKRFPCSKKNPKKLGAILAIFSEALIICSTIVIHALGTKIPWFKGTELRFLIQSSFLFVGIAVGFVLIATNMKPFYNKAVNYISSCTFGIYLLHDNALIRDYIWADLFHNTSYANTRTLFIHLPCTILIIFCVGIVIDTIRKYTIEIVGVRFFSMVEEKINKIIKLKKSHRTE